MSAKDLKGLVHYKAKDGKTYTLEYSFNAIAEMVERLGDANNIFKIFQTERVNPKDIRFLFWAGLLQHHGLNERGDLLRDENGEIVLTENYVGHKLMNPLEISELESAIYKALEYAFPVQKKME